MAVESGITVNEVLILEVDASPISDPVAAPIGSLAMLGDGVNGLIWIKTGGANSAWTKIHQGNVANNQIAFGNSQGDLVGSGNLTWNGSTLAVTGSQTISLALGVTNNATVGNLISNGYVRPANTADNTNGNIRFNGGVLQGREGGVWLDLAEQSYENDRVIAQATAVVSTSSTAFQTIGDITLTPPAGSYLVWSSGSFETGGNDAEGEIAIFKNATQIGESTREIRIAGSFGTETVASSYCCVADIVCNGSDTINTSYRSVNGEVVAVFERQIVAIRYA